MKLLKFLPLLSLVMFPLAPAGVEQLPQPLLSDTEAVACQDSLMCGRCGDGQCVKSCGETATSCPRDCGGVPVPY
jgi:hypothetical protein